MAIDTKDFLAARMQKFLHAHLQQETQSASDTFRPSLTISRQTGSGLERIKRKLVEHLDEVDDSDNNDWALFDQALVGQVIQDNRLDESVAPYLVENTKFPIIEAFEEVLNLHPSEWTLFNYTANTIRKISRAGHAVIVGRAGNFVTSDLPNTFHIRLIGNQEKRIKEIGNRHQIGTDKAKNLINETDKAKNNYVKRYTGADIEDPVFYHVIFNTDHLNDDLLVKLIADSLLEWAYDQQHTKLSVR